MKGLVTIPSLDDLLGAYERLLPKGAPHLLADLLALWSQWSRFDPRLAEQLVEFLARSWRRFDALLLREAVLAEPWPQVIGVLALQALETGQVPRPERPLFRRWQALVVAGIPKASGEQFFIGLRKFAGQQMRLDAERPIRSYARWGYLSREILLNKAQARHEREGAATLLSAQVRQRILRELMRNRQRLTVADYRDALGNQVSRRQAELDLAEAVRAGRLSPWGRTRARVYRVRGVGRGAG